MKIVLLHGWLRGNLGDECITNRLVRFLRQRFPEAHLTLLTEPMGEWRLPDEWSSSVHRIIEHPFRDPPDAFLKDADAAIQIPGGGLQDPGDSRAPFMLRDAELCHRLGIPHAFAGHSFHPSFDLTPLRGSLVLAREPESHALLESRGIPSVLSADPAFLEPMPAAGPRRGTLLFLRKWHFASIALDGRTLMTDGRRTSVPAEPLTLASSDPLRDDSVLEPLVAAHALSYERCMDLPHLLGIIAGAEHVISDRYHPVIFASMLGIPFTFLQRDGSLRDAGLFRMLQGATTVQLLSAAQSGFNALGAWLAGGHP